MLDIYRLPSYRGKRRYAAATADQSPGLKGIENGMPQIAANNVYVLDSANTIWALDITTGATR
jgi:hypothetical protein